MSVKAMDIQFTKMHGAGNDYVYIDCIENELSVNFTELAKQIADRHFGIGGDGLVVLLPSKVADFRMRMFNADGSEAQMCGNASRCVGKYLFENNHTTKTIITLETLAGIKTLYLFPDRHGKVEKVTVDMGFPVTDPDKIPVKIDGCLSDSAVIAKLDDGIEAVAVSMGNPHGVIFTDDITDELVLQKGQRYETHEIWPEKANIEFVKVLSPHKAEMRVWERGTGETLACGTGACAAAVAAILTGRMESPVEIILPGGTLVIDWKDQDKTVKMTGQAQTVANGFYHIPDTLLAEPPF